MRHVDCPVCAKRVNDTNLGLKHHMEAKHVGEWKKVAEKRAAQKKAQEQAVADRDALQKKWLSSTHNITGAELEDLAAEVAELEGWLQPYYSQNIRGSLSPVLDAILLKSRQSITVEE